jgi:hypothetical protein
VGCIGNWDGGGKECVHTVVGQTSWDAVSGVDINMILSYTSFFVFSSDTGMCGANVQEFDHYGSFCVAECYISWHFI